MGNIKAGMWKLNISTPPTPFPEVLRHPVSALFLIFEQTDSHMLYMPPEPLCLIPGTSCISRQILPTSFSLFCFNQSSLYLDVLLWPAAKTWRKPVIRFPLGSLSWFYLHPFTLLLFKVTPALRGRPDLIGSAPFISGAYCTCDGTVLVKAGSRCAICTDSQRSAFVYVKPRK